MGAKVTFRSAHGKYLCAEAGGNAPLVANRPEVGAWEEFEVEVVGPDRLALRAVNGAYVCAEGGGGSHLIANRVERHAWEIFQYRRNANGSVSLQADNGQWVCAELDGTVSANRPEAQAWEEWTPSVAWWSGYTPGRSTIAGPLRVDPTDPEHNWLANDAGRFDFREIGGFSLLARLQMGQIVEVQKWVREARATGCSAIRTIFTLDGSYWRDMPRAWFGYGLVSGPQVPNFDDAVRVLAEITASEGVYLHACLLGDLHMFTDQRDQREDLIHGRPQDKQKVRQYVERAVRLLSPYPHVFYQMANEYRNIGLGRSPEFLVELAKITKGLAPHALVSTSCLDGADSHEDFWVKQYGDLVSAHFSRDQEIWGHHWIKRTGEMPVVDQDQKPTLSGEPVNFGDWRRDGRNGDVEKSTAAAFAYGAVSRVRGYLANFHHDDALWTAGWGADTDRALAAWHRGLSAVPMLSGARWRGHWAEDPWVNSGIYPASDDIREAENHVRSGRGPYRIFGSHQYSVLIAAPAFWPVQKGLHPGRSIQLVDREIDGDVETSVYREG